MSGPTRYVQPGRHPTGSYALVLYDTTNPTNARPVFDGDSTWSNWVSDVFFFVLALIGLLLVYVMVNPESGQLWRWMRRRRSRFPDYRPSPGDKGQGEF